MAKKYVDYYKILGVKEDATPEEIKKAWKEILKLFHADLNQNLSEEDKKAIEDYNKLVNTIKDELVDPEKRRIYDIKRNNYLKKKKEKEEKTITETETRTEEKTNNDNYQKSKITVFADFLKTIEKSGFKVPFKLNREFAENIKEWVIDNGNIILVSSAIVFTIVIGNNPKTRDNHANIESSQTTETQKEEQEETVVINNYHIVEEGDTLSGLAQRGHISLEYLKEVNNIDRDTIYIGEELVIPFSLPDELLEYYTESIDINNRSLVELADIYETDIESLKTLNKEAITEDYGVLSNELLVPKFLTEDEYIHLKYHVLSKSNDN